MATPRRSVLVEPKIEEDDAFVFVYDRRDSDSPEIKIPTGGLFSFDDFKERVREALHVKRSENFVLATTNREEIKDDPSWDIIDKGDTLYVLRNISQELCAPAQERVNFLPHYDTIVKGGMYEYYASEGQNPLPYAFAELIDNALSATSDNTGPRNIEIRLHFDETRPQANCVFVLDNGRGMTPRQLNNWAIYRLSKFIRKDERGKISFIEDDEEPVEQSPAPLSLNSDISYFGVGGKQAIFFIGNATRMITKPKDSKDIHELTISKEEFKMKEINREAIYSGYIRNRQPGDVSHVPSDNEILQSVIKEEKGRESFTVVEIGGINPIHVTYLKHRIKDWTRQLAHIYHYYIHGPKGNTEKMDQEGDKVNNPFKNIDIQITMMTRSKAQLQWAKQVINLRDVCDDMQTMYGRSSASQFHFKATVEGSGQVEGILRYHPFLYDTETYPSDMNDPRVETEFDEHDYAINDRPARGRRPIFECYWNGRLIPYTFIENFDWCAEPKKSRNIPLECYNRISGVLFTNDHFQVSTNKLTFIDLEMKLREKNTVYTRMNQGQEKRTAIEREFLVWLKECHEHQDKQIHYGGNLGAVVRTDLTKMRQTPWTAFKNVTWDNKTFKAGDLVRFTRTSPVLLGTITRFFLYGEYEGNVYATGGEVEIMQEPRSLYDDVKIMPLSRLDRSASKLLVKKCLEDEETKLPAALVITWPDGFEVGQNEKRPAGKTIGALKIQIQDKRGEFINKLPGTAAAAQKKLLVELKLIWHGPHGDEVIVSHISQHGKSWPYWFKKMENIKNLGNHTLQIQVILNESEASIYAGRALPCYRIKFCVTEAEPKKFTVGMLEGPFKVGVPFQVPLEFRDEYNNITKPLANSVPEIQTRGLDITYGSTEVKGHTMMIKGIVAMGTVSGSSTAPSFNITIRVPGLTEDTQSLKIRVLPGVPYSLSVIPEQDIEVENGNAPVFDVKVLDKSGNVTSDGKLSVTCKFSGASGLSSYGAVCSNGSGTLSGEPILLKQIKDAQNITAKIELQGHKDVKPVTRTITVLPSGRVAKIDVLLDEKGKKRNLDLADVLEGVAGSSITGLSFVLIDEAGRQITMIDQLASKLKFNWTPKPNKDLIISGLLPDIKVPASVSDIKYCQISIHDKSPVDFNFAVSANPADPNQIKCKCDGPAVMQIGETLKSKILVTVKDRFGNEVTDLPKNAVHEFEVTGDGLLTDMVSVTYAKTKFSIANIKFEDGKIGTKDVKVHWRDLRDFVKIELTAGHPAQLKLPGWDPEETIIVLNESKLPRSLVVQLEDEYGNPAKVADIRIQMTKDPKIKLIPGPQPMKTNNQGQVDFGTLTVTGPKGTHEIQPKAFPLTGAIAGPKVKLQLQPNLSKPVSLTVDYDKMANLTVGEKFPEITVKVFSEDEQPMVSAKASSLSMKMWKSDESSGKKPPQRLVSYSPEAVKGSPGVFVFKDRKAPETATVHNILITYYDGKYELFSNVIVVNVHAAPPMLLVPQENPGTPTVSNTKSATARCVVRSLHLDLKDKHGNLSGLGYNGKVTITIQGPDDVTEKPTFVGGNRKLDLPMTNGYCFLTNLALQENTSGKDGQEYFLNCEVSCSKIPKNKAIPSLKIPFLFYNDAKKQTQMAQLSKQRDNLQAVISTYKSLFETTEQLIRELKTSVHEAQQEENHIRDELRRLKVPMIQIQSVEGVEKLIQTKTREQEEVLRAPRRSCGLAQPPTDPEILGKIGHLAEIRDEDIARVLSWHMSSDIDCVVTRTTRKAKEVYKQTQGKQQILPIDSIFQKNLPDWKKPLPHIKYRPGWRPQGNPAYARNFLIFSEHEEECRIVFGMLLGDTLILDNLDAANAYRQEIVKFTHCPTILTRDGDRVRSNGKFGGLTNKALPIEKLRGAVYSQPLSEYYHTLSSHIETLQRFKMVMRKTQKAKEELNEQVDYMRLPEMQEKYKECKDAEGQLKDIEQKLGMTLNRPTVTSISDNSGSPPPNKRSRTSVETSSTPVANGTPSTPNSVSTRQSKRLASMVSPTIENKKKRVRNS